MKWMQVYRGTWVVSVISDGSANNSYTRIRYISKHCTLDLRKTIKSSHIEHFFWANNQIWVMQICYILTTVRNLCIFATRLCSTYEKYKKRGYSYILVQHTVREGLHKSYYILIERKAFQKKAVRKNVRYFYREKKVHRWGAYKVNHSYWDETYFIWQESIRQQTLNIFKGREIFSQERHLENRILFYTQNR